MTTLFDGSSASYHDEEESYVGKSTPTEPRGRWVRHLVLMVLAVAAGVVAYVLAH